MLYSASASGYQGDTVTAEWTVDALGDLTLPAISNQVTDIDQNYSYTLPEAAASTGPPTINYSVIGLPNGLTFNSSTRVISGTPTTAGSSQATYSASAPGYNGDSVDINFVINDPTKKELTLAPYGPLDFFKDTNYNFYMPEAIASSGNPTVTYNWTAGPSGLTMDSSTRLVTGTPTSRSSGLSTYSASATGYESASITVVWAVLRKDDDDDDILNEEPGEE